MSTVKKDQPPLREVIAKHDLKAKKSLGQHFLLDLNITRRLVREAGDLTGITAIEIGPGPGGLTRALMESPAKNIVAIEKDDRFITALAPLCEDGRVRIIHADALEIDPATITPAPRAILANLPYNVGTLLLVNWLQRAQDYEFFALMFQKEVAERITAKVDSKAYGRLSVLCQFCCDVEYAFTIPARAFTPPPKIDSAVVVLRPKKAPYPVSVEALEAVTKDAFGQRRKMLRSIFKGKLSEEQFEAIGIRPEARAEELSVEDFIKLTKAMR
ncbi:MAG: 16S rRNA (adenine(1518)-N(6)/adenine(1519)-N(6))-dimethyltransferase RsmA [Alphaproteobacteria bacterium]|nr:16S rRNA (adenine(1518)-N(6)/adenine(1519)-N(6))-dimethyltransferase RsmA [Alphaproteobacteria bacterium]